VETTQSLIVCRFLIVCCRAFIPAVPHARGFAVPSPGTKDQRSERETQAKLAATSGNFVSTSVSMALSFNGLMDRRAMGLEPRGLVIFGTEKARTLWGVGVLAYRGRQGSLFSEKIKIGATLPEAPTVQRSKGVMRAGPTLVSISFALVCFGAFGLIRFC